MAQPRSSISLGFTEEQFPPGVHICQIVGDDEERQDILLKFLLSGLQAGDQIACFSEKIDKKSIADYAAAAGVSLEEACSTGRFSLSGAHEVYFQESGFNPERMLENLMKLYENSVNKGFPGARVIGEMIPDIVHAAGIDHLIDYESRVTELLRQHPLAAMCQYDSRAFDGATLLKVVKVHPLMVVRGSVVRNPFYTLPENVLTNHR